MNTPHKHAELIKAWADGAEIEMRRGSEWIKHRWVDIWHHDFEYRIKPEPKPDVAVCSRIVCGFAFTNPHNGLEIQQLILHPYLENANIKYTFDGGTGKLKSAKVL